MTQVSALGQKITRLYERISEVDRPEIWITLRNEADVRSDAAAVEHRLAAGEYLPLAGVTVAVKDNIDVAGLPTTCGALTPIRLPMEHARVVEHLTTAGAIVIGKTNMDQFATGLVGTRSPYGAVRSALDPSLISGGSSSGSAVSVALGIVDIALGTDTAGSGRIPAGLNGIFGIKPTLGLLSNLGVYPASPSYDTVSVFARDLGIAEAAIAAMTRYEPHDPSSRTWPTRLDLGQPERLRIGAPMPGNLDGMSDEWRTAFRAAVDDLEPSRWAVEEIDISFLLEAARLLYDGALVAERTESFGARLSAPGTDPTVAVIVSGGAQKLATELVRDQQELRAVKTRTNELWRRFDALLVPTAPGHPSLAEVAADPIGVNGWLGTFTNFVNLLDLAALAVPIERGGAQPVGVTFIGPAFSDVRLAGAAHRFLGHRSDEVSPWTPPHIDIAVFGAHMNGQPLNSELRGFGAQFISAIETAPGYRLYRLDTSPPKPGLRRVDRGGRSITGELWALSSSGLGEFMTTLARPMTIGKVALADGQEVLGFLCEPEALVAAEEILSGSWSGV